MKTKIINGTKITIVRKLPVKFVKDKGYRRMNPTLVRMRMYEILCVVCNESKSISNQELHDGRSLAHRGCRSKQTRAAEKQTIDINSIKRRIAKTVYQQLTQRCKSTGRKLELNEAAIVNIIFNNCNYCDFPPQYKLVYYNIKFNGIDRVDNNITYTVENSVACCKNCNQAKHTMSVTSFIGWLDRIARHNGYIKVDDNFVKETLNLDRMKELKL